jgi:hypothetical protein
MYFPIPKLDLQQPTLMGQLTAFGKWAGQWNSGCVEIQKSCGILCHRLGCYTMVSLAILVVYHGDIRNLCSSPQEGISGVH